MWPQPLPFAASLLALAFLTACQTTTIFTASTVKIPQAFDQAQAARGRDRKSTRLNSSH